MLKESFKILIFIHLDCNIFYSIEFRITTLPIILDQQWKLFTPSPVTYLIHKGRHAIMCIVETCARNDAQDTQQLESDR